MKKVVTRVLAMCFVVVMAMGLAGCSGKKEIVFWNPFSGPDGETMQKLVEDFNATNPEYTIKNVSMAGDDMYAKIPTVTASGKNIPDMGIVHFFRIPEYVASGILKSVDSAIAGQPEINADNYLPAAWQYGDMDGQRYSVPLDMTGWVVYYNKDLVEKYCPDALEDNLLTLDEIYAMGEAAKADGIYAWGGNAFTTEQFIAYCAQLGTEMMVDGKPNIDTDAARQVLQAMKDLIASGYSTKEGDDNYSLFTSNQIIFMPEGNWTANALNKTDYPDLNWGETQDLSIDNQTKLSWMSSHQMVVYNQPKQKEDVTAAKEKVIGDFMEFIRENSGAWANAGHIPASKDAASGAAFEALPQSIFMSTPEDQKSLTLPTYDHYGYVSDALNGVINDMLYDKLGVDEGLAKAQAEVADKLAQTSGQTK